MPFHQIKNDEGNGALYYERFNEPFDPNKETVLLLPTLLGHLGFLVHQYQDSNLRSKYNLLGVEPRHLGRSQSQALAPFDMAVAAADIAQLLDDQGYAAVHVFSPQATSNPIALRLASMFPERVLSLAIVGPNPVNEHERSPERAEVYAQMLSAWGSGEDGESWSEATHELGVMSFSDKPPSIDETDLFAHNIGSRTRYQPLDHYSFAMAFLLRKPIANEGLALIKCPTFIITGTQDLYQEEVEWYKEKLVNANVSSFVIEGAAHGASNTAPNLVNRTFFRFLASEEWPTEHSKNPVKTDWAAALARLPQLVPGIDVNSRSPERPMSFSTKSAQEVSEFESQLKEIAAGNAPQPRIAFGYGGPIYDHDVSKIKYRFSNRHEGAIEVDPSEADSGRFGREEWKVSAQ